MLKMKYIQGVFIKNNANGLHTQNLHIHSAQVMSGWAVLEINSWLLSLIPW